jgi:hypothetical protein
MMFSFEHLKFRLGIIPLTCEKLEKIGYESDQGARGPPITIEAADIFTHKSLSQSQTDEIVRNKPPIWVYCDD